MNDTPETETVPDAIDRYLARDGACADAKREPQPAATGSADEQATLARCDAVMALIPRLANSPDVAWAFDEAAQLARRARPAATPARRWFERPALAWGVAACASAVAVTALLVAPPASDRPVPSDQAATSPTHITIAPVIVPASLVSQLAEVDPVVLLANRAPVDSRSLAVLPFSGDAAAAGTDAVTAHATADAIYQGLIQKLRAIPGVYVIEPSVAAAYAESELPPEQIAMYLNVRGIVQGRVTASGDTVNFGLRFTDAAGDGTAIDTRFAAASGQIAQLENDITASLLDALTIRHANVPDLSL